MFTIRRFLILTLALLMPIAAVAQAYPAAPQTQVLAPPQLDQIVAPIALYPDPLVGQILMASTYPLEVVEAERWLSNPANAGLQGDNLAAALEQQPWDPSVKSLVAVPGVLKTLNDNIEWTEQLGNAFLAQQPDVMNAIQQLRASAQQAGNLQSTPQQIVTEQGSEIMIEPANPNVIYVPYYNPAFVYGAWPYSDYEPYYFSDYPYVGSGLLGFGIGVAVIGPLWGWDHWDWAHHRIDIDHARYTELNGGRAPSSSTWHFDPTHRHGVPYTNPAVRAQYQPADQRTAARTGFRGYAAPSAQFQRAAANPTYTRAPSAPIRAPEAETPRAEPEVRQVPQHQVSLPEPQHVQYQQAPHTAPVFESFSRGPEVRQEQQRGAQSRAAAPQAAHFSGGSNQEHERR